MNRTPFVVLSIVAAAVWILAWRFHAHLGERRAEMERMDVARIMKPMVGVRAMPAASADAANKSSAPRAPSAQAVRQRKYDELWRDPEYVQVMARLMRRDLDGPYGALFRRLRHKFPNIDIERLKTLLVEREIAAGDGRRIAREQRVHIDGWSAFEQAATKDVDLSIATFLGPAAEEYDLFRASTPHRTRVDDLAERMRANGVPLTSEQSEKLSEIVMKSKRSTGFGFSADAVAEARELLSPAQYEVLARAQNRSTAMDEMASMLHAAKLNRADVAPSTGEDEG